VIGVASRPRGDGRPGSVFVWIVGLVVVPLAALGTAWLLVHLLHGQRASESYRLVVLFLEFLATPIIGAGIGWSCGLRWRRVLLFAALSFVAFFVWYYVLFSILVWAGVLVSATD
jgi:hypothetical protein